MALQDRLRHEGCGVFDKKVIIDINWLEVPLNEASGRNFFSVIVLVGRPAISSRQRHFDTVTRLSKPFSWQQLSEKVCGVLNEVP